MWIFALVAFIIVGIIISGSMIPKEHVASGSKVFAATPEVIYNFLEDEISQLKWRKDLKAIERMEDEDGKPVWKETWKQGEKIFMRTEEKTPSSRIIRRIIRNRMFGGTWTFDIVPFDGGTKVTITENGEVYNPVFRLLGKLFHKPDASLNQFLNDLKSYITNP